MVFHDFCDNKIALKLLILRFIELMCLASLSIQVFSKNFHRIMTCHDSAKKNINFIVSTRFFQDNR